MSVRAAEPTREAAWACVESINAAWLDGRTERLSDLVHPAIVMALPGFSGRIEGAAAFIGGFEEFYRTCRVHSFEVRDRQAEAAGGTAVVSFAFEMLYERGGERFRSTGRDLWVLAHDGARWLAVWRTMLDLEDTPEPARA